MRLRSLWKIIGQSLHRNGSYILGVTIFIVIIFLLQFTDVAGPDQTILGNFIEWYGILFSVLLALVIVHVWTKYNTIDALIDKEADALVSLLRFARFMDNHTIFEPLAKVVDDYCTFFCQPRLSYRRAMKDSREKLDKIFLEILQAVKSCRQSILTKEIIRCFDEAMDIRGDRDAIIKERIPPMLWFMMVFTSMIWLISFFWLAFRNINLWVAMFMLFSTSLTVLGLLLIAKDIDNPVSGMWKISFAAFQNARDEIEYLRKFSPAQDQLQDQKET